MAVLIAAEELRGRRSYTDEPNGERSYTRHYMVIMSDSDASEVEVKQGVLGLGSRHPEDPGARVAGIKADQREDAPWRWDVEVTFKSRLGLNAKDDNIDQPDRDRDPTKRPATLEIEGAEVELVRDYDFDNKPLVNTANEPVTGITLKQPIAVLRFSKFRAAYSLAKIFRFQGALNATPWFGCAPYTAWVKNLRYRPEVMEQGLYWNEETEIHINPDGWRTKRVNAGFFELVDGEQRPIMIGERLVTRPWPLRADGQKCFPANNNQDNPDSNTINFLDFRTIREVPFTDLGVP